MLNSGVKQVDGGYFTRVRSVPVAEPLCIDVGANLGQETIPITNAGCFVHAFEPVSSTRKLLADALAAARVGRSKAAVHAVALSDRAGRVAMHDVYPGSGVATMGGDPAHGTCLSFATSSLIPWFLCFPLRSRFHIRGRARKLALVLALAPGRLSERGTWRSRGTKIKNKKEVSGNPSW